MDFLDHELGQMLEHISELPGIVAPPGRHILEQWLLARIEFDDIGNVSVDRLVVGDAGARRIDEGDAPGTIEIEQAGDAERRVGPEGEGVEKIIVDPAIDDIDALWFLRSAHIEIAVVDEEVGSFAELDT